MLKQDPKRFAVLRCAYVTIWILLFKQRGIEERNLSQSKDDSFVERVAKNNS